MDGQDERSTIVYFFYDGRWILNKNGEYEWEGKFMENQRLLFFCPPCEVTYSDLVRELCAEMKVEKDKTKIRLSYLPNVKENRKPTYLWNDKHVHIYLLDKINGLRGMLYVEIGELRMKTDAEENVEEEAIIPADGSVVGGNGKQSVVDYDDCFMLNPNFKSKVGSNNVPEVIHLSDSEHSSGLREVMIVEDSLFSDSVFTFSDGLNITVGHEFDDKEAAQEYVRKGAAVARFRYTTMRSDKKLWELRCKFAGSGCNWRLRTALILNSKRWSVRKHNPIHSCKPVSESSKSMSGTKKLVRDYLKDEFPGKLDNTPSAHEIIDRVKAKYGTTVTYLTALRGKHKAESEIRGDPAEHFRKLPGWLYMLQKRNPGTIVSLELDTDDRSFKYLFITLGATVKGWNYMHKVVAIDATFLTGQYKGTLVVATAQDGDHHQYPLA
ncbi:PREDICTED: uncharacterized protein LOC104824657 [Tarenaya hassleriana]|uniref:uncharacterized protein LOC104824657 n=1 Tax=Tarenaya hassleriana TaxID=28532 RepID=UPI00053C1214|nr:PREDICTED: uncharacterized protein LOC104824657 [Tarenaya hassleriana]